MQESIHEFPVPLVIFDMRSSNLSFTVKIIPVWSTYICVLYFPTNDLKQQND
jgi:hypothetical protein